MPAKIHLSTKGNNPSRNTTEHILKKYHLSHLTHLSVVKGNKICPQRKARQKSFQTFRSENLNSKKLGMYTLPQHRIEQDQQNSRAKTH